MLLESIQTYASWDGVRAILVLLFAIAQAVMAFLPEVRKWPNTIATRSAGLRNPVVPIDRAFAIWGIIFLSSLAFGIWQLLPPNLDDPLLRQIGWLSVGLFACNTLWELYVPKRALDGVSVAIIIVELILALTILITISAHDARLTSAEWWFIFAPFQIFAGWVSAAVFVNLASTLQGAGYRIGNAASAAMILVAASLAAAIGIATGGWIYSVAVAWALFGIVIGNTVRDRNLPIAILSGAMIPFVIGAVLFTTAK